ncbi:multiprotein-bridging factor 1 family protein [Streptomyces sp. NPDC101150]|uniref:helix-turn-helix domain-containing protein n=1 Tax=Streptomyces sp. NPDC101150 TaxID=3366114 RepID=UPI0038178905
MGRRDKPLADCEESLKHLALWLRAQRQRAGLTYAQLAEQTDYHATTLQRAADGQRVPAAPVVRAYAKARRASEQEAQQLHRKAMATAHHAPRDPPWHH